MTPEEEGRLQELEGLVKRYRSRIVALKAENERLTRDRVRSRSDAGSCRPTQSPGCGCKDTSMSTAPTLYRYQCPICKTTLTAPVRAQYGKNYRCDACGAYMRYLWSDPADVPERLALHQRGLVYHHPIPSNARYVSREKCGWKGCYHTIDPDTVIDIPAVGRFCSADCAQKGVEDHEQFMTRLAKHRDEMPWLYETKEK